MATVYLDDIKDDIYQTVKPERGVVTEYFD